MMKKVLQLLTVLLLLAPAIYAQPANDACLNATNLGSLPAVTACPPSSTSGFNQGANTTLTTETNVGATSSAPYPFLSTCPINISSPPKDVWYTFIATGYQTTITVSGATGTLTNPCITLWEGSCANLEGLGCSSGSGGTATLTVYQTIIGRTYYIQVAGADSTQTGAFTLSAASANNCAGCLLQSYITATPEPINGSYNPGQTVEFCYTVTQWDEGNANWLHGVTVTYGSGWDSTSLVVDSLPPTCTTTSPGASWGYYPNGQTSSHTGAFWGPGFYYETSAGSTSGVLDNNPGNNYGDYQAAQTASNCFPTFCLSLTAKQGCAPGSDLSVHFYASGDGESGSWGSPACAIDPTVSIFSVGSCCPPVMGHIDASCNQANGIDTASPVGNAGPYLFQWSNGVTQTLNGPSIVTGLAPGIYHVTVTNALNCVSTAVDTIGAGAIPHGGSTQYVSCPTMIDSVVMGGVGVGTWSAVASNPAPTVIANPSLSTTSISGFTAFGTYKYAWTQGCASDTVSVIVTSHPNAGPDVYTCVNGTARMAGIGTGIWVALPSNPVATTITNPTANNTNVTGFLVGGIYNYVWTTGNCVDTASVIIPNFVSSAAAADTVLCRNQSTRLTATAGPAALGPFSYSWTAAGSVLSPSAANTATTPLLAPTTYIVAVQTSGGCVLNDTVFVNVSGAAPLVHILPSNNNVCPGDTVSLTGIVFAENLVTCGLVDTCASNNLLFSVAVNNDTTSSTGSGTFTNVYCSPFMGSYNSYKAQYLFTKGELNAAGLSSGSITDLSFFVKQINSTAGYDTFTVSMGCTNQDSLTDFVNNLLEVVPPQMGPNAVFPNSGWTPLPFTHYYNWDGASNLVVQICYTIAPSVGSQDDFVAFSTSSYLGSSIIAADYSFFGSPPNGCSLTNTANVFQILKTRPNIKFGMCAPNVLTYQWTPSTLLCDSCQNTQVIVTTDSIYKLTVNDLGCANDTTVHLMINRNIGIFATPDTTLCGNDTVRLNVGLTNPPVSTCVLGYSVASIPYAGISGIVSPILPVNFVSSSGFTYATDDGTAGPYNIGFTFPFYCSTYNQFYINSNGWVTFESPYPATTNAQEYTAQTLPPVAADMNPQKVIELMMGNYYLADGFGNGGGTANYFLSGSAPNRVLVVQFDNMADVTLAYTTTGELHLHEGSGVIDILITSSNYSGTNHTTGVKDSTGFGTAAPGRNNQPYTVTTSEAWRFTPQFGASVAVNGSLWSPNTFLSNDSITNPLAYPPASQTYYVTSTLVLNQFTNPTNCVVHDSVRINVSLFPSAVTASPVTICPGDTSQLTFSSTATVASYHWTPSSGLSGTTIANPTASVLDTTTYYVTAVNNSGCSVTDTVTVNVYPTQHPVIGPSATVCYSDSQLLTVAGLYSNYQWYLVDSVTGVRTLVSSGAADTAYYAHPANYYVLRVNPLVGQCAYYSNLVLVDTFPKPAIPIIVVGPTTFCLGGEVTLEVTQGLNNIQWTPSTYGSQIALPISSSGMFYYSARDAHNCLLYSDTVTVNVQAPPAILLNAFKNPVCSNDIDTLIVTTVPSGQAVHWSYNGTVSTGDTLIAAGSGTYAITATQNGCSSVDTIILNGAPSPAVTLPLSDTACNCHPMVPVIPTVTGGTPGYSYQWSNGAITASTLDSILGSSSYTVTVTDANHCSAVSNTEPFMMSCPGVSISIEPISDTIFLNDTAVLTATPSSSGTNYGYIWSSDSAHVISPDGSVTGVIGQALGLDTVYLLVTDKNTGCPYTTFVTINVIEFGAFAMPTAFTPNGDQRNDNFYPAFNGPNSPARVRAFRIYNRWGQMVYDNPNAPGWDGNFGGNAQVSETYLYFITFEYPDPNDASRTIQRSVEGSFQLLR